MFIIVKVCKAERYTDMRFYNLKWFVQIYPSGVLIKKRPKILFGIFKGTLLQKQFYMYIWTLDQQVTFSNSF